MNNRSPLLRDAAMNKIAELGDENQKLKARVASLENELAGHRKRAQVESLLKRASKSPAHVPSDLVPKTVEDYFDKLDYLCEKGDLEIRKIAGLADYAISGQVRFGLTGDDTDDSDKPNLYRHIDNYRQGRGR